VTKSATAPLQSTIYRVEELLVGKRVGLIHDPCDLAGLISVTTGNGVSQGVVVLTDIRRHVPKKAVSATADDTETGAKTAASGSDYLRIVEARHKSTVAGLVVVIVIDVAIPHPSCRESPCVPTRVTHRRRCSTAVRPQTAWGVFQRLIAPFREPEKGKSKDMARTVIDAVASGVPAALFALRRSGTCRHRLQLPLPHHLDRPIAAQNWPIQTAPACCIDKSRSAAYS